MVYCSLGIDVMINDLILGTAGVGEILGVKNYDSSADAATCNDSFLEFFEMGFSDSNQFNISFDSLSYTP